MFQHFLIKVGKRQSPFSLERYLANHIRNYTPDLVSRYIKEQRILVNGIVAAKGYVIKPNDEIHVLQPYADYRKGIKPENIELSILFEDEYIVVIDKPAGMAVHAGLGTYSGTLHQALLYHLQNKEPHFIHRLDKHTSGVIAVAKTKEACTLFGNQFSEYKPLRIYHALIWGHLPETTGKIEVPIGRNPENERSIEVSTDHSFGKIAITNYKLLRQFKSASVVELQLQTGRTHQIRVHMQHTGNSIILDQRYSSKNTNVDTSVLEGFLCDHHMLHALQLGFSHPYTHEMHVFRAPYPKHFTDCMQVLENE